MKYLLNPADTDTARLKREREKARLLRKTTWWKAKTGSGICHYCKEKFQSSELTMDHLIPLARGGETKKSNVVPACHSCNQSKKLSTPAEEILDKLFPNS